MQTNKPNNTSAQHREFFKDAMDELEDILKEAFQ